MIARRVATVLQARAEHAGLTALTVQIDDERAEAVSYDELVGPVAAGDRVLVNTTAVDLGLGTGGVHFVIAVLDRAHEAVGEVDGHAMKLRYTPMQTSVLSVEESHADLINGLATLEGMPVIVAGLHSAVAPAAIGIHAIRPDARVAFVMTDGAALMLAFSRTVPALVTSGLIHITITAGQAVGGMHEAITVHGALAAAKAVCEADVVIVAMGPGNLGSGTRWGSALMETAEVINAAAGMGARPILVPRISFADQRERHRGVSHHTRTVLEHLALARAQVAIPTLTRDRAALVLEQLAASSSRHDMVEVDLGAAEEALVNSPVALSSMGRGLADDPDCFRAAAAAGVHGARLLPVTSS